MKKNLKLSGILGCLGLFLLAFGYLYCEEAGIKYFENFTPEQYDHFPQNWQVIQDGRGFIYVANQAGLLEFDGANWRVIRVPGYDPVRSLAIDGQGRMFIGGENNIGYLFSDQNGTLQFVSILDIIEEEKKSFGNVWKACPTKEGIYFRTSKYLFRWNNGELKVWPVDTQIRNIFSCQGNVYVQVEELGLMILKRDDLQLIPGGEIFAHEKIWMMAPYDVERNILLGTRSAGFYLYNGQSFDPFPLHEQVDNYIKKYGLYYGTHLSSGDYALATSRGGLVIMDDRGRLKYIVSKRTGLQNDIIRHVLEDKQGNLWLALNKGISRIEYSSPFSHYDDRSGLPDLALTVTRHQGDLYAGSSQGLYVLRSSQKIFHPVHGITSQCSSLLSNKPGLLAATSMGLFQVNSSGDKVRRIIKDKSFFLLSSREFPGTVWCAAETGLIMLQREGSRWLEKKRFMNQQGVASVTEGKKGNLWLVMQTGKLLGLDFRGGFDSPVETTYDSAAGVPEAAMYCVTWAVGHVIFLTDRGLYRLDEGKKILVPDTLLGEQFAGGTESMPVFRLVEDRDKNIWFHSKSRNYRAIPGKEGIYTIYSKPFHRLPTTAQVNDVYLDSEGENLWLATHEGLIRYDLKDNKDYDQDFNCMIRRIDVNEALFWNGSIPAPLEVSTAEKIFPIFEYKDRNLRFKFAAPFFEAEERTQYRCLLEGYDEGWSPWNNNTRRDYTNLGPGLYTFRVQAQNVYDTLSREDSFKFRVLPPWYRTWWAYLSYVGLFFFFMFLGIKWRSRILELEKQKLEQTVKERTKEIAAKNLELEQNTMQLKEQSEKINVKNRQLETQTLQLTEQSEKLQEMDRIKSRFFANISHEFRTPLTLIMGPLEQILTDSRYPELQEKTTVMLRNSRRLSRLINQLLDLSKLDSGKMRLQARKQDIVSFLQGVVASFEWMAGQEKQALRFKSDRQEILLYFDGEKMEKIFGNLLANAVKFTPKGGTITVSVTGIPDQVEISVKDTGIGIASTHLPHIFDRFFQVDDGSQGDNAQKGSGVGLALTRELVTLHHGRINVHSTEGIGTEFIVRLPLGDRHLEPEDIASEPIGQSQRQYKAIDQYLEVKSDETVPSVGETTDTGSENTEEGWNVILVVEDNADMRKYIRESLEASYKVIEAADGGEGIRIAKESVPDLIISDIMMPGIDGYELCRELKENIATSHIPIIMLTAKASEDSMIQGLETGADDYVTKPFSTQILLTRIKNIIDLRRQLQDLYRRKMFLSDKMSISTLDDQFLEKYRKIIKDNFADPEFTLDILCTKMNMGRSTLFKKVKALTGEPPNQHILYARLECAALLLKDKSRGVTDVALEVGFSSPAYFAKCFKERFHQSPRSYQTTEAKSS